jgi:hypothetical protein
MRASVMRLGATSVRRKQEESVRIANQLLRSVMKNPLREGEILLVSQYGRRLIRWLRTAGDAKHAKPWALH